MPRSLLCLAILFALLCVAHADQAIAAGPLGEGAEPKLDLSFDPAAAEEQEPAPLVPQTAAAPPARDVEKRFSVGVDIKTRREVGSAAARATAERPGPPTLADKIDDIVERSSIGVTGTYRF